MKITFKSTKKMFCIFFVLIAFPIEAQKKINIVKLAHEKQHELEAFEPTSNANFKVKVFTVERPQVNKIHHWFVQVLSSDNLYVNYGSVSVVKGYLKTNPSTAFNFMNPVMALCNEGKYIIGFVDVNVHGVYRLDLEIDNFGIKDTVSVELKILDESTASK